MGEGGGERGQWQGVGSGRERGQHSCATRQRPTGAQPSPPCARPPASRACTSSSCFSMAAFCASAGAAWPGKKPEMAGKHTSFCGAEGQWRAEEVKRQSESRAG